MRIAASSRPSRWACEIFAPALKKALHPYVMPVYTVMKSQKHQMLFTRVFLHTSGYTNTTLA